MSSYTIIKKNDVTIGSWSRNSELYDALECASYEDFEKFDPAVVFPRAEKALKCTIEEHKARIKLNKKLLKQNLSYEDSSSVLNEIEELKSEIKTCKLYIHYLSFMMDCFEEDCYGSEPAVWTWTVG